MLGFVVTNCKKTQNEYCVKSVRIRSFSGRNFPTFGLNTDAGKHGPEKLQIRTLFTQWKRYRDQCSKLSRNIDFLQFRVEAGFLYVKKLPS